MSDSPTQNNATEEAIGRRAKSERGSGWIGWESLDDPAVKERLEAEKQAREEVEKTSSRARRMAARQSLLAEASETSTTIQRVTASAQPGCRPSADTEMDVETTIADDFTTKSTPLGPPTSRSKPSKTTGDECKDAGTTNDQALTEMPSVDPTADSSDVNATSSSSGLYYPTIYRAGRCAKCACAGFFSIQSAGGDELCQRREGSMTCEHPFGDHSGARTKTTGRMQFSIELEDLDNVVPRTRPSRYTH